MLSPVEGGVALHTRTDSLAWFARQLARLPFDFEVIQPAALRDELRRQAARLQRLAEAE